MQSVCQKLKRPLGNFAGFWVPREASGRGLCNPGTISLPPILLPGNMGRMKLSSLINPGVPWWVAAICNAVAFVVLVLLGRSWYQPVFGPLLIDSGGVGALWDRLYPVVFSVTLSAANAIVERLPKSWNSRLLWLNYPTQQGGTSHVRGCWVVDSLLGKK